MTGSEFIEAVNHCKAVADSDDPIFNMIRFNSKGSQASDRFTAGVYEHPLDVGVDVSIPQEIIKEAYKETKQKSDVQITDNTLSVDGKIFPFKDYGFQPDIEQFLSMGDFTIRLPLQDLLDVFADMKKEIKNFKPFEVLFTFESGTLSLMANKITKNGIQRAERKLPVEFDGKFQIMLNTSFLTEILKAYKRGAKKTCTSKPDTRMVNFTFTNKSEPVRIGMEGSEAVHIVAPVRFHYANRKTL